MKSVFTLIVSLFTATSFGQSITWSAPVSIAPSTYGNYHPRIVLDRSGDPMVLWGTGMKAAFAKWNGSSFSTPVYITSATMVFGASWAGPDIANHGDTVYVVVKRTPETDSTMHSYLLRSYDGGQSFQAPVRLDYIGDSLSRFPTVTTDAVGNPIVGFMKFNSSFGDARYVVTRSMDYGASFMADRKASAFNGANVCDCCPGAILSSGNKVVMLYRNNASNIRTMWAGISTDNGNSFNGLQVDNTNWMVMACPSSGPDGVIIGDSLYTVFRSSAAGTRIYTSKASITNPQLMYSSAYAPGFPSSGSQDYPRIANAGDAGAMVWKEVINGKSKACMAFTSSVPGGFPSDYDTVANANVNNVDVAMRPGEVHVVWENTSTGTVMYRKGTYNVPNAIAALPGRTHIDVYPNPAKEYITIPVSDVVSCSIADITGRKYELRTVQANGQCIISVAHLAPGSYTLTFSDKEGKQYSSKVQVH
jgi:hypothetical protein